MSREAQPDAGPGERFFQNGGEGLGRLRKGIIPSVGRGKGGGTECVQLA